MKKNVVLRDFSGGMTGDLGQFAAKDITYLKTLNNMIVNRGGTVAPRPGFENVNINLLTYDKILPFRFKGEDHFLVYDPLLKRRWIDTGNTGNATARRMGISGSGFASHNQNISAIGLVWDDYLYRVHEDACNSTLLFIQGNIDVVNDWYSETTQQGFDNRFISGTMSKGIDVSYDSFFWSRFLIYNSNLKIVCYGMERSFYVEEDSGNEQLISIPFGRKTDPLNEIEFDAMTLSSHPNNYTSLKDLRERCFGGSDLRYEAIVGADDVVFMDNTGNLPPLVWNPSRSDFIRDMRVIYHGNLSWGYFIPSYLESEERSRIASFSANYGDVDFKSLITKQIVIDFGLDVNNYNSPFVGKPPDDLTEQDSDLRVTDGFSLSTRQDWNQNAMDLEDNRSTYDGLEGGMDVRSGDLYAIYPVNLKYVTRRMFTNNNFHFGDYFQVCDGRAAVDLYRSSSNPITITGNLPDISYTSWRVFLGRHAYNARTFGLYEPVFYSGDNPGISAESNTPTAFVPSRAQESYMARNANQNYLDNYYADASTVGGLNGNVVTGPRLSSDGKRGFYYSTHRRNFDGTLLSSQSTGTAFKQIDVFSAPMGYDIIIPNVDFNSFEFQRIKNNNDVKSVARPTYFSRGNDFLSNGANKGKYWKYGLAAFGRIGMANYRGRENVMVFGSGDPNKLKLDFSTLALLVSPVTTPPSPTNLLGGKEVFTPEGGLSIIWLDYGGLRIRVGTNRGIIYMTALYSGSSAGASFDTSVNYANRPAFTDGNEYYLAGNKREIFYNRYSEEYQTSRSFNVSFPLTTDVLTENEITHFDSIEQGGQVGFVAGGQFYLGVVDDSKKDTDISWCRIGQKGKIVDEMLVVGGSYYLSLSDSMGRSFVKFDPFGNMEWEETDINAYMEFLSPWVYMMLAQNYDLSGSPETGSLANVKVMGKIRDGSLVKLGRKDEKLYVFRNVEGIFVDDGSSNINNATSGLKLGFKNKDDVLDTVIFNVGNN